jgi:nucleoside-diphosphate-sugar epimerase
MKLAAEEILTGLLPPGVELLSLRLSNVYGPRQRNGLMPYLVKRILKREPITIDADGAQVRDFVHVQDVAAAFVKALQTPACNGVLNIGSGRPTSIISLLRLLEEVLEIPATGQYCPEHSGGERGNTVNVARAREALGWQATIALAPGTRTLLTPTDAIAREGLCV